jgi:hypothetical protein
MTTEQAEEYAELIAESAAHKTVAYLVENLGTRLAMFGGVKAVETELFSSVSNAVSALERKKN